MDGDYPFSLEGWGLKQSPPPPLARHTPGHWPICQFPSTVVFFSFQKIFVSILSGDQKCLRGSNGGSPDV